MRPRKLKLSSGTWRFLIDSHETTLWSPSGQQRRISNDEITGARHSCYRHEEEALGISAPCPGSPGTVTPGNLRAYIEERLLAGEGEP